MEPNSLNIVSWNINGIRATKTPLESILNAFEADIICLQETKTTRDLMDETIANVEGYNSYFSFSRKRSGYSGVVTYCKNSAVPMAAEEGLTGQLAYESSRDIVGHYGKGNDDLTTDCLKSLDGEGRAIITKHVIRTETEKEAHLTVINVYCPRADPDKPERLEFKQNFYKVLQVRSEAILASGSYIVIVGDINTSHKPIDHCDPDDEKTFCSVPSRKFLEQFLALEDGDNGFIGGKFVDTFRYFHPKQTNAFTCWRTDTGARQTNYGTRLDYIFSDIELLKRSVIIGSEILTEVSGSDHCPVKGVLRCVVMSADKCPALCTKYWPEFAGRQTKLVSFLNTSTVKNKSKEGLEGDRDIADKEYALGRDGEVTELTTKKRKSPHYISKNPTAKQKPLTVFFKNLTETSKIEQLTSESKVSPSVSSSVTKEEAKPINAWKELLRGPKPVPLCSGHNEPSVLRTVKKAGPNVGRDFFVCARPQGHSSNSKSSCNFFKWASNAEKCLKKPPSF